MKHKTPKTT